MTRSARQPHGAHVCFAAATGLRPSELRGLRVGRLNLLDCSVEVSEALAVVKGRTEVGRIKTGVRRTVRVPRSLCQQLRDMLAETQRGGARPAHPPTVTKRLSPTAPGGMSTLPLRPVNVSPPP